MYRDTAVCVSLLSSCREVAEEVRGAPRRRLREILDGQPTIWLWVLFWLPWLPPVTRGPRRRTWFGGRGI